jgi:DNA-binding GntR family transcriptional regulator
VSLAGGLAVSLLELLARFSNAATTADAVYQVLRHCIIYGELLPGSKLRADALAKEMHISRTPVRDALRKLETEGLAVMSARLGLIVPELSENDLIEAFQIREVLEGLAAKLTVENATPAEIAKIEELVDELESACARGEIDLMRDLVTEYRQSIYRASHNERLLQLLIVLQDRARQFRSFTLYIPGRPKEALEEYRELVQAIKQRDAKRAEELARSHRRKALTLRLQMLREQRRAQRASQLSAKSDAKNGDSELDG